MMETILNLGLNDATVEGLGAVSGNPAFAWDSYRRFVQMYASVVFDLRRSPMERRLEERRRACGVSRDIDLPVPAMRALVQEFKELVRTETGKQFPEQPLDQLWGAIAAVFESWNTRRAIDYRKLHGIPDTMGTAVNVVAMVFGMPLALFPALSERLGGVEALGILYAAPAIGALVAGVTSQWTHRVTRHGRAVIAAAAVWGVAIIAFGLSSRLWPAVACLAVAGGADAVSAIFRLTIWNQTIPNALRGRLASIEMVSYASGPQLGHVEAGLVAAMFGVTASVISGGVLCVAGVIWCGLALPGFARYDSRRFTAEAETLAVSRPVD
jgi:hypothetical protein